jgi:hypothetical protein
MNEDQALISSVEQFLIDELVDSLVHNGAIESRFAICCSLFTGDGDRDN